MRLDTLSTNETPEGISIELRCAGVMPRAAAWIVDSMVHMGMLWVGLIAFAMFGEAGEGLAYLLVFVCAWGYNVAFEVLGSGRTPGKRALGLQVVMQNGAPIGWLASITRNLLRVIDALPFCYGFGALCCMVDPKFRRLGDLVAGSMVVHVPRPSATYLSTDVPIVEAPVRLSAPERAAIVDFSERISRLSSARQTELAELLEPLTNMRGAKALVRVLGIARGLVGR